MKTLSILRHAKSSWEYPELVDFDRPILTKGVKRTILVCNELRRNNSFPDSIILSPALRAKETAAIVVEQLGLNDIKNQTNKLLYPGYAKSMVEIISTTENSIEHVMIVGHNPGLTDLANHFLPNDSVDWIPTSGLVQIEFDSTSWKDITSNNAKWKRYLVPKELKNK